MFNAKYMPKKSRKVKAKKRKHFLHHVQHWFERGKMSAPVLIIIAVIVVALGGAGLYLSKTGNSPLSALVKAPLNPNCELKDPELCKFMNNWKDLKNFTIHSASKDSSGTSESTFEVQGDNSHMSVNMGKDSMEMINLDNTTYTKDFSDGKWWKTTYDKTKSDQFTKDIVNKDTFNESKAVEDKTTYKALGKEACGDLMCFKYQVIDPADTSMTQYIWFDDKDYLLRKQSTTDNQGVTTESTFSYNNASISAPSPVKEGTPESMYGGQMNAADKANLEQMQQDMQQQIQSNPQSIPDTSGDNAQPTDNSGN